MFKNLLAALIIFSIPVYCDNINDENYIKELENKIQYFTDAFESLDPTTPDVVFFSYIKGRIDAYEECLNNLKSYK